MNSIIEVEAISKYGNALIYPVNEQAHNACAVVGGQKTLTMQNIAAFKRMGFTVRQVVRAGDKLIAVGDL